MFSRQDKLNRALKRIVRKFNPGVTQEELHNIEDIAIIVNTMLDKVKSFSYTIELHNNNSKKEVD